MSYETKAGVAVSCSFLCLVGVVLTSKLWDGQAANADTTPEGPQSAEVTGPPQPPIAGVMAPQSSLPNLQTPPTGDNGVLQVKGPEMSRPLVDMDKLFSKPKDPFQQEPLVAAEPPQNPSGASQNPVVPNFNAQPAPPPAAANQPANSSTPTFPLAAAEAGIADPKKAPDPKPAEDPGFAAMAAALKKKAADGEAIGNGVVDLAPKAGQSAAAAVIPEVKIPPAPNPAPSVEDALLAAKKKGEEEAAALNGTLDPKLDPKKVAAASTDNFSKELEKQKSLEQAAAKDGAANLKDPGKNGFEVLSGQSQPVPNAADAALAGGRQQINNGAGVVNNALNSAPIKPSEFSMEVPNAGKAPQGNGAAPVIPAMGAGAGSSQPQWPAGGPDGYPGRAEAAALDAGSRPNAAALLGAPTQPLERTPPPDNQFAQLRGNQTAPPGSGFPPVGTRAEVSAPVMAVKAPITPHVDSHSVDKFTSRTGDTYQSLAQEKYGSASYGQALMLYNRDYPMATDATKRDPETIVASQTIFIPPVRILQRDYGSVIPEQSAASAPAPGARVPAPTAPVVTTRAPLPEKRYRVPGGGAMFLTIARTKLGDENRWPEIYQLNPSFEPINLIPGGTVLRMPGDAKLDPADVPVSP